MQVQKPEIRNKILQVAQSQFLKNGYLSTSMRSIASAAGIGVGNIYNYFKDKNGLFYSVVSPVITRFSDMLIKHHNPTAPDINRLMVEDAYIGLVSEYIELIKGNRARLKILFFRSEGSDLEHFSDTFSDKATALIAKWFESIRVAYPDLLFNVTPMTIHMHATWELSLLREIIAHNITDDKIPAIMDEYIRFEIAGWRHLLHLENGK